MLFGKPLGVWWRAPTLIGFTTGGVLLVGGLLSSIKGWDGKQRDVTEVGETEPHPGIRQPSLAPRSVDFILFIRVASGAIMHLDIVWWSRIEALRTPGPPTPVSKGASATGRAAHRFGAHMHSSMFSALFGPLGHAAHALVNLVCKDTAQEAFEPTQSHTPFDSLLCRQPKSCAFMPEANSGCQTQLKTDLSQLVSCTTMTRRSGYGGETGLPLLLAYEGPGPPRGSRCQIAFDGSTM